MDGINTGLKALRALRRGRPDKAEEALADFAFSSEPLVRPNGEPVVDTKGPVRIIKRCGTCGEEEGHCGQC